MQKIEVRLFLVDKYSEPTNFKHIMRKADVIDVEKAFTYGKLRKSNRDNYHFFKSKVRRTIVFGKVLTIMIRESDFELLQIIYGNHKLELIDVDIICVEDIYRSKFDTLYKDKVYTFVSEDKSVDNRNMSCGNFTKYFLI